MEGFLDRPEITKNNSFSIESFNYQLLRKITAKNHSKNFLYFKRDSGRKCSLDEFFSAILFIEKQKIIHKH